MGPLSVPSVPSVVRACTEDTKLLLGGGTDLWLSSGAQPWLGVPAALSQVGRAAVQRWCGQMVSWQDVLLSCFFPTNCYLASVSILKFPWKKTRAALSLCLLAGRTGVLLHLLLAAAAEGRKVDFNEGQWREPLVAGATAGSLGLLASLKE